MVSIVRLPHMPYNVVFFGTSDFSVPSLRALLADARFNVVAVVTKPDAPIGRHQVMTPPPVKVLAQEHIVKVLQFEKIKTEETYEILRSAQDDNPADAFVIVSYGKIIPQRILDLPKHGCINVHGSLLPRWRGASCVQSAIASGDEKTGITIMLLDAEMDHGPVIAQVETAIGSDETGGQLHDRLAELGAATLPDSLDDYLQGKIKPQEQDYTAATACKILTRNDGRIDWQKPAQEINRLVRAFNPWPGTWTEWDGKRIKILKTTKNPSTPLGAGEELGTKNIDTSNSLGQPFVFQVRLLVKCGDDQLLEILELQPEGKKPMASKEYLAGHRT